LAKICSIVLSGLLNEAAYYQSGTGVNYLMDTSIKVNLDLWLVQRRLSLTELSEQVGITMANLSILKRGRAKAIRFSPLIALGEALICLDGMTLNDSPILASDI
jgi:putative transcriptional regulator